jgi:hypothetical protein
MRAKHAPRVARGNGELLLVTAIVFGEAEQADAVVWFDPVGADDSGFVVLRADAPRLGPTVDTPWELLPRLRARFVAGYRPRLRPNARAWWRRARRRRVAGRRVLGVLTTDV